MTQRSISSQSDFAGSSRLEPVPAGAETSHFQDFLTLTALLCRVPHVSLCLTQTEWDKVMSETDPSLRVAVAEDGFFLSTIASPEVLWIDDVRRDDRFDEAALQLLAPGTSFYAGVSVFDTSGVVVGALSIMAPESRGFDPGVAETLHMLGRQANALLEVRSSRLAPTPSVLPSTSHYQQLFDSSDHGVLLVELGSGQILDANPSLIDYLGLPLHEIRRRRVWELGAESSAPFNRRAFEEIRRHGSVNTLVFRWTDHEGHENDVALYGLSTSDTNATAQILLHLPKLSDEGQADKEFQQVMLGTLQRLARQISGVDHDPNILERGEGELVEAESAEVEPAEVKPAEVETVEAESQSGVGALSVSARASGSWSNEANLVVQGIREVMARRHQKGQQAETESQLIEQRWFNTFVTYFMDAELMRIVVAHQDSAERQAAEKQINFQANLLDTVGEAVIAMNLENEVTYWNKAAENLFGWTAQEAVGARLGALIIPDAHFNSAVQIQSLVLGGESWTGDFVFHHKSGDEFPGLATNSPIYDDGKIVGLVGVVQDITERKRAEILLRESEERFRLLVDGIKDFAMFLLDSRGFVSSWNSGAERLLGYQEAAIIGKPFSTFFTYEDIEAGKPAHFLEKVHKLGQHEEETLKVRADGSTMWTHCVVSAICDDENELVGLAVITRDYSEHKQAEVQLHDSEERFRFLVEGVHDYAIFLLDPHGLVTSWNVGAQRLKGYDAEEIIGQHFSRFYLPEDIIAGKPQMELDEAAEHGSFEEEGWRLRKDGTRFWASVLITAVRDENGELRGFSKVTRDITERRQAEEALEKTNREILTIWESMTDAFVAVDLNWTISYANEHTATLWQRTRDEVLGQNLWDVFPEAADLSFRYEYQRAMDEQHPVVFEEYYPPLRKWFEVHAYPSSFGLSIYFRDISERKAAEQQIRISELRFQGIVANAPGMVFQLILYPDGDTEIPFVNDGCRRLFGLAPEEIRDNNQFFNEVIHPADLADWERSLVSSAAQLNPWDWEGRVKLANGEIKWLQGAARPKRLLNGGTLWDGLLMEITDRKVAEEERDRFFTLSLDMLGIADSQGYFRRLNPAFEATLGHSLGELRARPFIEFVHPDDRASTAETFEALVHGKPVTNFVNRYLCKDGSYKWLSWQAVPYEDLTYAVAHDITPLKEAETALRKVNDELEMRVARRTEQLARSNQELQGEILERQRAVEAQQESYLVLHAVIEGTTDIIFVKDMEGRYLMINSAGAEYVGATQEEILGKSDHFFFSPESSKLIEETDRQVMADQVTQTFEQSITLKGETRTFSITKGVHRNPQGQVIGTIGMARDITDLKRQADALRIAKEEADIANQAKSEFLSRMSHELRTPLNAILGYGQILEMRPLDPEESLGIAQILSAGWHLLDLVNEILDIARVEAGHIELSLEPIDLAEIVPECCSLLRPLADQRDIRLSETTTENGHCHVRADRQRLKQVLLNLLSNAIKYNSPGGKVDISCELQPNNLIHIAVTDTGFGLSSQDMERIFTPFERLNASNSRIEGSGLGLALSQRLLAAMDGTLGVESVEGEGSTFWIELPYSSIAPRLGGTNSSGVALESPRDFVGADTNARYVERLLDRNLTSRSVESGPNTDLALSTKSDGSPVRILVVEDNQVNQQIIVFQLKNLGFEVEVLDNGLEAIEQWQDLNIDLILMDCNMPRMSGYAAASEIRRLENGNAHVPIVALTANAMSGDREKCLAAGMDDYLSKPIKQGILSEVLGRWLSPGQKPNEGVEPTRKKEEPAAILSRERWNELQSEIDAELLSDLCQLFLDETPGLLESLKGAFDSNDAKAIGQAAHKIKGSCATMGASRMAKVCREIENSVEAGHVVEAYPLMEQLTIEYDLVKTKLDEFVVAPENFTI